MIELLKVTPGKWVIEKKRPYIQIDGELPGDNPIAHVYKSRSEFRHNYEAIVAAVNFFKEIDVKLFKQQRFDLLNILEDMEAEPRKTDQHTVSLEGVIQLLDALSDILVDSFGCPENAVMLTEEE